MCWHATAHSIRRVVSECADRRATHGWCVLGGWGNGDDRSRPLPLCVACTLDAVHRQHIRLHWLGWDAIPPLDAFSCPLQVPWLPPSHAPCSMPRSPLHKLACLSLTLTQAGRADRANARVIAPAPRETKLTSCARTVNQHVQPLMGIYQRCCSSSSSSRHPLL